MIFNLLKWLQNMPSFMLLKIQQPKTPLMYTYPYAHSHIQYSYFDWCALKYFESLFTCMKLDRRYSL